MAQNAFLILSMDRELRYFNLRLLQCICPNLIIAYTRTLEWVSILHHRPSRPMDSQPPFSHSPLTSFLYLSPPQLLRQPSLSRRAWIALVAAVARHGPSSSNCPRRGWVSSIQNPATVFTCGTLSPPQTLQHWACLTNQTAKLAINSHRRSLGSHGWVEKSGTDRSSPASLGYDGQDSHLYLIAHHWSSSAREPSHRPHVNNCSSAKSAKSERILCQTCLASG